MLSGGIGSWAAGKRAREQYPDADFVNLFCDTKVEDVDTYRFMRESAANIGGRLIEIADGRDIWQVFKDTRFLGNSRVATCSQTLKLDVSRRWLEGNCDPARTVVIVGIDWTEVHRYDRLRDRWAEQGWTYEAPLCDPPYLTKDDLHAWAAREGLAMQRLYQLGAAHANCGGGCVKMGIGGFARLYQSDPCTFAEWEANEADLREFLERDDVAILRDRTREAREAYARRLDPEWEYRTWKEDVDGDLVTRDNLPAAVPITLSELRERLEAGGQVDMFDIGGCGCFVDDDAGDNPALRVRVAA